MIHTSSDGKRPGITVEKAIDGWAGHSGKTIGLHFLKSEKEVLSSLVIFNGENRPIISDHLVWKLKLMYKMAQSQK